MPLTEQQIEALPVLEWLLGNNRRSGRTLALAVATIRTACRNPGLPVYFIDHFPSNHSRPDHLRHHIESLLFQSNWPDNMVHLNRERLIIRADEPFEWEPNLEFLTPNRPLVPPEEYQRRPLEPGQVEEYGQIRREQRDTLNELIHRHARRMLASTDRPTPAPKPALQRIIEES